MLYLVYNSMYSNVISYALVKNAIYVYASVADSAEPMETVLSDPFS
jgi:hypothetical protein